MSKEKIVFLNCETTLPIPTERVVGQVPLELDDVLVIGQFPDGEVYISSTTSDLGDLFWLLELAKNEMRKRAFQDDEHPG